MRSRYAPRCAKCKRQHDPARPCWEATYSITITRHVLATQGRICWLAYPGTCSGIATQADHIVPRSEWGSDDDENLRPACKSCNSARHRDAPFTVDAPPVPRPGAPAISSVWGRA